MRPQEPLPDRLPTYQGQRPLTNMRRSQNLTFHVTSRIDVQVGGRDSRYKNENDTSTSSGFLYGPTTLPETPIVGFSTSPAVSTTKGAFTYLFDAEL